MPLKIAIDSKKIQGPILNRAQAYLNGKLQKNCSIADEVNNFVVVDIGERFNVKKEGLVEIKGLTDQERKTVHENFM